MAELKTKPTDASVTDYLNSIDNEQVRKDCFTILEMLRNATHAEPIMWGDNIVGFGTYHYVYASGREGDWPLTGFSPRKQNITLYIMLGFDQYKDQLARLGKHTHAKSCLYIKRLSDIHRPILVELLVVPAVIIITYQDEPGLSFHPGSCCIGRLLIASN